MDSLCCKDGDTCPSADSSGLRHVLCSLSPTVTPLPVQFCPDVQPGNARAKECLEENREQPGFTPECKAEVEKMMAERAADFRLDAKLKRLCAEDIDDLCAHDRESLDLVAGYDARVIQCLQDFRSGSQGSALCAASPSSPCPVPCRALPQP